MSQIIPFANSGGDIVESGSNSYGSYIKYRNGVMECWGQTTLLTASTTNGAVFISTPTAFTFPMTFITAPNVSVTVNGNSSYYLWASTGSILTSSVTISMISSTTGQTGNVNWRAIGTWSSVSAVGKPTYTIGRGIIESGSNSYGSYLKYEDGTMEQWGSTTLTTSYRTAGVNFPQAFADLNYIMTGSLTTNITTGISLSCGFSANTTSTFNVTANYSIDLINYGNTSIVMWRAIGRWQSATNMVGAYTYGQGIVETGTNSNGTYIKFDNGTMICVGVETSLLTTATATTAPIYYVNASFTYPATFISSPISLPKCRTPSALLIMSNTFGETTSGFNATLLGLSSAATGYLNYTAIGRWK